MPDPVTMLALAAVLTTGVSVVLAWTIPDAYDRLRPEPARLARPR